MLRLLAIATITATALAAPAWSDEVKPVRIARCIGWPWTLTNDFDHAEAVVVAKIESEENTGDKFIVTLDVLEVLKGAEQVPANGKLKIPREKPIRKRLINGPELIYGKERLQRDGWTKKLELSRGMKRYYKGMTSLPRDSGKRLELAAQFVENYDFTIRNDVYAEIATASFEQLQDIRGKIDRSVFMERINSPKPGYRHAQFFLLLSVNGSEADLPIVKQALESEDGTSEFRNLVTCYLMLGGQEELRYVVREILLNPEVLHTRRMQAFEAMRFVEPKYPRGQWVLTYRVFLDEPAHASLALRNLARVADWESLPQVVRLFEESEEKEAWIRNAAARFLKACPLPEAKEALERLKKIDASIIERAEPFPVEDVD